MYICGKIKMENMSIFLQFGANKTQNTVASNKKYDFSYNYNGSSGYHKYGITGNNGIGRQTGSGGAGSATVHYTSYEAIAGVGSEGTSYAGGSRRRWSCN